MLGRPKVHLGVLQEVLQLEPAQYMMTKWPGLGCIINNIDTSDLID